MASSEFWQKARAVPVAVREREVAAGAKAPREARGALKLWIAADVATVVVAAMAATALRLHTGPATEAREVWHGTLIHGRSMGALLALLCGFTLVLISSSRRLNLYAPLRMTSFLREQWLSLRVCLTSGLLLTGTLYLVRAEDISRLIVVMTVGLVTVGLGLRRLIYRVLLYRRFERGVGTRNVLIVGTGEEAQALRLHLESIRGLGYTFKGFIQLPGGGAAPAGDVVGTLETLFQQVRKRFVDEIFFTAHCDRETVRNVLEEEGQQGVELRMVRDLYDGQVWSNPIEYIGQFPTIPLHFGRVPELGLVFKRAFDLAFSSLALLGLAPLMAAIAIAIKLDSPGPVFYPAERLGKKGRVFRCLKFRTMAQDADQHLAELLGRNERDGVLFKVTNDPRVTRLGRFLRKYSLDELPQFWNVLKGEMSVVGPRPPLASEVEQYKLSHLRRLDVMPGITGLWQVQGRRDPSFASYVSLDMTYIDHWSIWLDFQIILRTVAVVFAGSGT
jgi:exopolysaccharide biosynthesis polyprenyl glycosylphosphotransferase